MTMFLGRRVRFYSSKADARSLLLFSPRNVCIIIPESIRFDLVNQGDPRISESVKAVLWLFNV